MILNSPHNPTGGVLSADQVAASAAMILETGAWVLSDEVYSQMIHDGTFASIATEPGMLERTILLDGCSKTFAMTGWRCGFAAVPEPLVDPLVRFFVNSTSCVPPFVQHAAIAALEGPMDEPDAMMREFRARRRLIVNGLNSLPGVSCRMIRRGLLCVSPERRCAGQDLRTRAGGAPARGARRCRAGGHGVRRRRAGAPPASYANSQENITEAIERIRASIAEL